jgi:hypothetical protein
MSGGACQDGVAWMMAALALGVIFGACAGTFAAAMCRSASRRWGPRPRAAETNRFEV